MEQPLLEQFQALYEKQDVLSKLTNHTLFSNLSLSEVHCLAAIDHLDEPNASMLATDLRMTRGAVSKIIKKLAQKELIEMFQKECNKKEKYFKLTKQGEAINDQHTEAHQAWEVRDTLFLQSVSDADKAVVSKFLEQFNAYLEQLIKEKTS